MNNESRKKKWLFPSSAQGLMAKGRKMSRCGGPPVRRLSTESLQVVLWFDPRDSPVKCIQHTCPFRYREKTWAIAFT